MKTKEKLACSSCGKELAKESKNEFDGTILCVECLEQRTTVCDNCGDRVWNDDVRGDANVNLCSYCYEHSYIHCERCGRMIHNDNAYYLDEEDDFAYCFECKEKIENASIKSYNYKPEPIFYGSGNLFMGVELEIDKGGENDENASNILCVANLQAEHVYCKHDGSIENGFEMVSHPMSYEYHLNSMNWKNVFETAIKLGYRSHQTDTCGLHIHCSRSAFGKTYEEQERVIGRVVFFVEKHWNELVKFSRRSSDNLNRWAAKYATISDTTNETYKKAKDKRMGRYVAVNLENYNTIEFRLFRGTLCHKTFIATLQLVDEICYQAIHLSDAEMEGMSWSDFVSRILPKKGELIEYLKLKRLYINDAIEREEDM